MNIATISKQIRAFADQLDATSEVEKPDPYAELKAAHAAGKVIQCNCGDERAAEWEDIEDPEFSGKVSEYRIKPEEPAFQLPPPPPGVQWIKGEWESGDLPQGTRPLAVGEHVLAGDEWKTLCEGTWLATSIEEHCVGRAPTSPQIRRTTRPLTFEHAGKTWTYHRPGDPMPCDGERKACIMYQDQQTALMATAATAGWARNENRPSDIIGWRYADEKKTVPLGPEDVPPGSAIRGKNWAIDWSKCWLAVLETTPTGVHCNRGDEYRFTSLQFGWQINRSLPLTGKWNPDAWEPCSKTLPA